MAITQQRCVCGLSAERMNGASVVRGEHAWIDCVSVSMCLCVYNYVCITMCVSVDVPPCVCMYTSVCNYPYVPASLCISLSLSLRVPVPLCLCLCVSMSVPMFICCRFPTAWSVTWKVKCAQETDNKVQGMHWEC